MSKNWKIIAALATVYLVWGSTFLAIRVAITSIPPFFSATMRCATAGLLMVLWGLWQTRNVPSLREWRSALILGCLMFVSGNGFVVWAEQIVPSGLAALVISTVPIWLVGMSAFKTSQMPSLRVLTGIVLGLFGVYCLFPHTAQSFSGKNLLALMALLTAAFSWSLGTLLTQQLPLPSNHWLRTGMSMLSGGVVLFMLGVGTGEWQRFNLQAVTVQAWAGIVYLIIGGSIISFSAYMWLTKNVSTTLLATYAYVNPVVAVFLGWFVLGEPFTSSIFLGAGIILAGVLLISWRSN